VRSSAGAVLRLPIDRGVDVRRVVQQVRDRGGEAWATAARAEPLQDWRPRRPTLLFFGAEGPGLDDASITMADGAVSIELDRGIDSLNVAVAAGILLHHLRHL
jgi:TrmH family RNA methyltransferase